MTIMATLGPKARDLVQAGRTALRPTPVDRERIANALRAELGPAALPPQGSVAPPPPVAASVGLKGALGAAIGIALAGGALLFAYSREKAPALPSVSVAAPSASPTAPPAPAAPTPPSAPEVVAPSVAAQPSPSPSEPSVAASAHTHDRLAEEVALLSRATKALRAGHAAEALAALDEHQAKFPRGALSEERRAAKAEALCSLGRVSEGRAQLAHLAPQSPTAARAKQVCDQGP
jgi:hypothetical protein